MKSFLYGFLVALIMCSLFFYFIYSNLDELKVSDQNDSVKYDQSSEGKNKKIDRANSALSSSLNKTAEPQIIEVEFDEKQTDNKSNAIDYNTAQLSEILPSISSEKGILGDNIESFLASSQFETVLFSLEKNSEEAYQVQDDVNRVLYDKIKAYPDIHIRNDLNCDDRICLVAVEFDSYEALNEFSQKVLSDSKKSMAGTSAVIKEGEQKIARIIYNHKKAAFVYTPQ